MPKLGLNSRSVPLILPIELGRGKHSGLGVGSPEIASSIPSMQPYTNYTDRQNLDTERASDFLVKLAQTILNIVSGNYV